MSNDVTGCADLCLCVRDLESINMKNWEVLCNAADPCWLDQGGIHENGVAGPWNKTQNQTDGNELMLPGGS